MGVKVIAIKWGDQEGTINEKEAFLAAEAVEDHLTIFELSEMMNNPKKIRTSKLSKAYCALCTVAGIKVDPDEVRREMVSAFGGSGDAKEKGKEFWERINSVMGPLLDILADGGGDIEPSGDAGADQGNAPAPASTS